MRRRNIWLPIGSLLATFGTLVAATAIATAASSGGNGLRVSPVRTDVTISPGKSQVVTVNVTNVTSATANLQTIANDFIANPNESGEPAIILNPNQYAASHSLKRFIAPTGSFSLAPGQQKAIPVTINVPANAAGGGYYGAIRFAPATNINGPNQTVSLAGSVGSLILLKVPGDIKEQLAIASLDARTNDRPSSFFVHSSNIDATVRFKNNGNLQEAPFGKVLLKNHSGKVLGTYEVNNATPPGNVLPDSIRKFSIPLKDKVGSLGEYKLEGNFGYGGNGQLLSASTTFYVIPLWLIVVFVVVVLVLLFLIFVLPRLVAAYNRRLLSRAGRALGKSKRQ